MLPPVRDVELNFAMKASLVVAALTKAFDNHREQIHRPKKTNVKDRGFDMAGGHRRNTAPMLASPRCGARTRSGSPCRSPAVNGKKRCRMHGGAKGSGAPRGNKNALSTGPTLEKPFSGAPKCVISFERHGSCSRSSLSDAVMAAIIARWLGKSLSSASSRF